MITDTDQHIKSHAAWIADMRKIYNKQRARIVDITSSATWCLTYYARTSFSQNFIERHVWFVISNPEKEFDSLINYICEHYENLENDVTL